MMQQYHDLLQRILDDGDEINTERTGVGTIATFGEQLKFDMRKGFPAITTKKLAWKSVVSELIWFNRGSDNIYELREILHGEEHKFNAEKKTIWDDNYYNQAVDLGYQDGFMGDIYGSQWRNFGRQTVSIENENCCEREYSFDGVDQIQHVLNEAKINPQSRRLLVSAWNPSVVWKKTDKQINDWNGVYRTKTNPAALPPCHMLFQLNIVGNYIDLQWYQRSVDAFLGLPFNIASYGLQLHKFARILGKTPRHLVGALGNVHIYKNHVEQVKEQLTREHFPAPMLWMNTEMETWNNFENSSVDDYHLIDYRHHETIKAKMAV